MIRGLRHTGLFVVATLFASACVPEDRGLHLKCYGDCCGEGEIGMMFDPGPAQHWECRPQPPACDERAACGASECRDAIYAMCGETYLGYGCDDEHLPPDIKCRPR